MLYPRTTLAAYSRYGTVYRAEEFMKMLHTFTNVSHWSFRCMALGLGLLCPLHAGTIVFDNSTSPTGGSRCMLGTSGFITQYQSFSDGGGSSSLTDVKLLLQGSPTDSNSFSVDLYADSSTSPGSLLDHVGSLNDMSLIANASHLFDFPTAAFALSAKYPVLDWNKHCQ